MNQQPIITYQRSVMLAVTPNPALNLAPFGRWTLRDKTAQAAHFYVCAGHGALLRR